MSVSEQLLAWGVACVIPLILNSVTRREADAVGLSFMLTMAWVFGRVTGAIYEPPTSMALYPIVDALSGAVAFMAWRSRKAWWKLTLVAIFIAQCAGHAAFWLAYLRLPDDGLMITYIGINNTFYALALLAAMSPGGGHVLGWIGSRLPRGAWRLRNVRAGRQ